MKTAYDLTRNFLTVLSDIDATLDKKSKVRNVSEQARLDKEIDNLEVKMLEIKNQLKNIKVR
jgi:hypothetical protein